MTMKLAKCLARDLTLTDWRGSGPGVSPFLVVGADSEGQFFPGGRECCAGRVQSHPGLNSAFRGGHLVGGGLPRWH